MDKKIIHSLGHAVLVLLYTSGIALLLANGERIFGSGPDSPWLPVAMLMLFVLSAAITGSLVLARPIMMYLDGQKKEALQFFTYTVGWLFILTLVVFIILAVIK